MNPSRPLALAAALLLLPLYALAQQPSHPAPHAAAGTAVAPDAPAADAGTWFGDDPLTFALAADFDLDGGDLDHADGDTPPALDDASGPDDPGGVPARGAQYGPGGGGMGMRRGGMRGGPMFHRRGGMDMRMRLARLDLTEAQRTKLRDLNDAHARKGIQRRADMQLARMDLRKLMRADKPDAGAVNAQIDKLSRMQAEGLKAAFELRMQARAVLTPEQLQKLRAPMNRHDDGMDSPDGQPKR